MINQDMTHQGVPISQQHVPHVCVSSMHQEYMAYMYKYHQQGVLSRYINYVQNPNFYATTTYANIINTTSLPKCLKHVPHDP